MQYPLDAEIEALLEQKIRGSSANASFLCPVHDEDVPSFSIHRETGLWYCFSCGAKGNIGQLYYKLGESEPEERKLERLIRLATDEPQLSRYVNMAPLANSFISGRNTEAGKRAILRFCGDRPIDPSVCERFGVGYRAEKKALTFPYFESDGTVSGIRYRHVETGKKWYEGGSKRVLYGIPEAVGRAEVIICEGESDTLGTAGRTNPTMGVCGIPGANVSESVWSLWSLDLIFARRIYLALDADEAGDKGADTAMRVLGTERCVRARPTRGKDLCEHYMNGGTLDEIMAE